MLFIFIDSLATPFLATLIGDHRCFWDVLPFSTKDPIDYQFSYQICIIYSHYVATGGAPNCAEYYTTERSISFYPPFIYSGECRDAVVLNFIPLIINQSVLQAFIYPLLYMAITNNDSDLNSKRWYYMGSLRKYILTNSGVRIQLTQIWSLLVMLITYGILSPFATVAIAVNAIVQVLFLRANILRYFHLQVIAVSSFTKDGMDSEKTNTVEEGNDDEQVDEKIKWAESLKKFLRIAKAFKEYEGENGSGSGDSDSTENRSDKGQMKREKREESR